MTENPGNLKVEVGIREGHVCAILGDVEINYLKMTPDQARNFAMLLVKTANSISRGKVSEAESQVNGMDVLTIADNCLCKLHKFLTRKR